MRFVLKHKYFIFKKWSSKCRLQDISNFVTAAVCSYGAISVTKLSFLRGRGDVRRGGDFFCLTLTSAQGCDYLLLSIMSLEKSHTKSRTHHRCITGLRRCDVETEFGKRTLSSTWTIAHIFRKNFDQNRAIMIQDNEPDPLTRSGKNKLGGVDI